MVLGHSVSNAEQLETLATLNLVDCSELVRTFIRLTFRRLSSLIVFLFFLETLALAVINVHTPKLVVVCSKIRVEPFLANWANYNVFVVLVKMHCTLVIVLSPMFCAKDFSAAGALEGQEVFLVAKFC